MPELAEVEWYRKQWDPGHGADIIAVRVHPGKYVLRGTNEHALRENLAGKKMLKSERHKHMSARAPNRRPGVARPPRLRSYQFASGTLAPLSRLRFR